MIVIAQLPISHWIEGRRRMRALALMPLLWAVAWLIVDGAGYWLDATAAFVVFAFALALFGIGECFHGPAHQALVADIGPRTCAGATSPCTPSRGASPAPSGPPSAGSSSRRRRSPCGRSPRSCASSRRPERS